MLVKELRKYMIDFFGEENLNLDYFDNNSNHISFPELPKANYKLPDNSYYYELENNVPVYDTQKPANGPFYDQELYALSAGYVTGKNLFHKKKEIKVHAVINNTVLSEDLPGIILSTNLQKLKDFCKKYGILWTTQGFDDKPVRCNIDGYRKRINELAKQGKFPLYTGHQL